MDVIDLSGTWTLRDDAGAHEARVTLPGDAISALFAAGIIPDPYWGRNEYACRWIAERDWTMSRTIKLDRTDLVLVLDQVDTVATVRLNGTVVLNADNAFRRYRKDVSSVLRIGENHIEIQFSSSVQAAAERQAAQPFPVPYQADNCPIPNPNMLRKPQCDFGWDWNIALAPFGIYGTLQFEPILATRLGCLAVSQDHHTDGVTLTLTAHLEGKPTDIVEFEFMGRVHRADVDAKKMQAAVRIDVTNPKLWWPAGYGDQTLHDLTVRVAGQVEHRRIGLRKITLVTEPDDIGAGFAFHVNGVPIFSRGANWIPADALPSRIAPEKTRDLLQSAVEANMNMIRVWGGGRYEPDWFYDICDELGLMVWQDFMFACALYPSDEPFLTEIDLEVRETVRRLHHHASIALWCGDNENVGALTWFEDSRNNRDRYLAAYDRLNHTIERALMATDPTANWWPSSPSRGRLDFGDGWHDDTAGDMHFWSVWHEGRDFEHYRDVKPRFCSEFGFQSYPSMDRIRTFAEPEDFNIAAPVFESHQKNAGGNARIAETMFRYFRFPEGFENFVYLSQVQQAIAIKTAVTFWRMQKPRCMGALYWQLNDTWPVCSWSSLDYGGGWKLLHYAARDFFAPVMTTILPTTDGYDHMAVVDMRGPQDVEVEYEVSAVAMSGALRPLARGAMRVPVDAPVRLASVRRCDLKEDEVLVIRSRTAGGNWTTDHHAPHPYKFYDLPDPGLSVSCDGNEISITSECPAFFVAVESDTPGRFDRNGLFLLPDTPERIRFIPNDATAVPRFAVRDLFSATSSRSEPQGA